VNAHEAYQHILSVRFPSFEHVGSPPPTEKFLDKTTVTIEPPGRNVSVPGADESWMDDLSAVEALQPYGFDPIVIMTSDGKLEIAKDMSLNAIYSSIPFQVEKSTIALFIAEFLYRCLPEHYINQEIFELIKKTTQRLDSTEKLGTLPIHFIAQFALEMGFLSDEYELTFENTRSDEALLHQSLHLFISTSIEQEVHSPLNRELRKSLLEQLIAFCSSHLDTPIRLNSLEMFHEIFD
jgi:DNA repair protein RecO (recombination protein O)